MAEKSKEEESKKSKKNADKSKEEETKKPKKPPPSDVFSRAMGDFKCWHFWVCSFALFLIKFPIAFHLLNIVFVGAPIEFTCKNGGDKCAKNCTKHIFSKEIFKENIVTQWDLVCTRKYLTNFAQMVTMIGILVGNVLFGYWADRGGRHMSTVVGLLLQAATGTIQAFVPWYTVYLIFRFACAIVTGGTMVTSFVLIMEFVGPKWRTTVGSVYQIPFNLGHLTMAMIAYFLRDWKHFQMAISIPSFAFIFYYWVIPESPRWLITVGKTDKAITVMEKVAKYNKLPTEDIRKNVMEFVDERKNLPTRKGGNVIDLLRTRNMRTKTICIWFNWLVCGFGYFGVSQYLSHLSGDVFFNQGISAVIAIPGVITAVFTMPTCGRRATLIASDLIAAVACIVLACIQGDHASKTYLAAIALYGFMMGFTVVYIFAGELFPTIVRNVGIGMASMCGRLGCIIAPNVSTLGTYYHIEWITPLIFGIVPLIGAILCFWLPETLKIKLPDTLEDAEKLTRKTEKLFREEI